MVSGLAPQLKGLFPTEPMLAVEKAVSDGLLRALDDEGIPASEVACNRDYSQLCPEGGSDIAASLRRVVCVLRPFLAQVGPMRAMAALARSLLATKVSSTWPPEKPSRLMRMAFLLAGPCGQEVVFGFVRALSVEYALRVRYVWLLVRRVNALAEEATSFQVGGDQRLSTMCGGIHTRELCEVWGSIFVHGFAQSCARP